MPLRTDRELVFEPTPAITASRARARFIPCPACHEERPVHLFHKTGVRFVRCSSCGVIYVNPTTSDRPTYFDIAAVGQHEQPADRKLLLQSVGEMFELLQRLIAEAGLSRPTRSVLLGRYLPEFADLRAARALNLEVIVPPDVAIGHTPGERVDLSRALVQAAHLEDPAQLIILNEFLESCDDASSVIAELSSSLAAGGVIAVIFGNTESFTARVLRRSWPRYFDAKSVYFTGNNLDALLSRHNMIPVAHKALRSRHRLGYIAERFTRYRRSSEAIRCSRVADLRVTIPSGLDVAIYKRAEPHDAERLSVIVPVYNEARYVGAVLDALLAKKYPVEHELIVVESNSTDGSREIVRRYENLDRVTVIYEDQPRGKGHAVRSALKAATGTIILIQDADFEYDLDDYDVLLHPILQRQTSFVLGSRSLGLDDWKVRRYSQNPTKGLLMNLAQVGFAKTFNLLYRQRVTDVNTMFKVFRRECLNGVHLISDGFALDIELVCKIVRSGYAPMEVPVNYVSRGFDEGKKINFLLDAWPSYWAFVRFRFGR